MSTPEHVRIQVYADSESGKVSVHTTVNGCLASKQIYDATPEDMYADTAAMLLSSYKSACELAGLEES